MTHKTRESWLKAAVRPLAAHIKKTGAAAEAADHIVPEKLEVIVSWPHGAGRHKFSILGQCFGKTWTKDKTTYVTITPTLEDPIEVLSVLTHELVHACGHMNHGAGFAALGRAAGLVGKPASMSAGPDLVPILEKIAAKLGPYPHVKMFDHDLSKPSKPKGRSQVKLVSPDDESYIVWMSPKMFAEHGAPLCPISGEPMIEVER